MKPELLAPAGSPDALRAAVEHGADAVYLAWGSFNARRGAQNFSEDEFAQAVSDCHVRGVRVFLTLNILLSDRELPSAVETARQACRLGVDAVLVQDWGLFFLLRRMFPDLPLHASTQMSLFTSGGAREAAADGCQRVVLARECSGDDIAVICKNCPAEIEVFVHGALCMCYSGQCAMSALIGGRSGNRGRCAQPCRLPYGVNEAAGTRFPLSLKDNCLAGHLGELTQMGAACLKIEGRMRRPSYVGTVVGIYARLLEEQREPTADEQALLEEAFSRSGFTDAYWHGTHGSDMFGIRPENAREPDTLLEARTERRAAISFRGAVKRGLPCSLTVQDEAGHAVSVTGPVPENARTRAITVDDFCARLQKTGGTPYRCVKASAEVDEGLSLPASAVNALRRDALDALSAVRSAPPVRRELMEPVLPETDCSAAAPQFTVSVEDLRQITPELLDLQPKRVSVPLVQYAEWAVPLNANIEWCVALPRVWRDRDEPELRQLLQRARALGATGAFVGNLGHLPLVRGLDFHLYGDFGLNVFNSFSLAYLNSKGLSSACVSFELRFAQIRDLRKILPVEAIVYGRLPLMITENCLVQNSVGCHCGQPNVLIDRTGAAFPLLPAWGHRTEVENSRVLWLADRPEFRRLGLQYARLRFTAESPEECVQVFRSYLDGSPAPGPFTRGLYQRGVE